MTLCRRQWADYFDSQNIRYAFFSAANATAIQQARRDALAAQEAALVVASVSSAQGYVEAITCLLNFCWSGQCVLRRVHPGSSVRRFWSICPWRSLSNTRLDLSSRMLFRRPTGAVAKRTYVRRVTCPLGSVRSAVMGGRQHEEGDGRAVP